METGPSANRAWLEFDGAAGSHVAVRVQGFKFQSFRMLHQAFLLQNKSQNTGEKPHASEKILQRSAKACEGKKQTALSQKLDWTCLLYTQLIGDLQLQKLKQDPERALLNSLLSHQPYSRSIRTTQSAATTPWVLVPCIFIPHVSH